MAITPTPNNSLFKGFVFDGVDSRDYGVHISGDAVFNAPERDVEMIEIPGRNGAFALDKGRFSNIEVTYPAGMFGTTEADFAAGINALRNALASRKGYCRLEDDYNQNEYRMAVYKSGLDVTPAMLKAGEFEIVFDCKPQRFLKSGETAQAVTSGGTITNPTLFEAKPLLQVWGYGGISINDEEVSVSDVPIGRVILANAVQPERGQTYYTGDTYAFNIDTSSLDTGDSIYGSYLDGGRYVGRGLTFTITAITEPNYESITGTKSLISISDLNFTYGTASTNTTNADTSYTIRRISDNQTIIVGIEWRMVVSYDGDKTITIAPNYLGLAVGEGVSSVAFQLGHDTIYGDSTISALGTPLLIDLDIGEAYKEESGEIISSNTGVALPAELPTLKSGANTITYDNTVTQLKIVPHWWEV